MWRGMQTLQDKKAALRRLMLAGRAALAADAPAAGEALMAHVLRKAPPPPGAVVAGFWPMGVEIDVRPLLLALHGRGHALALPFTPPRGEALRFRAWAPGDSLARGPMGTQYPAAEAEVERRMAMTKVRIAARLYRARDRRAFRPESLLRSTWRHV